MSEDWRESVEEHRDTLEAIADGDGPLSDDAATLLEEADGQEAPG